MYTVITARFTMHAHTQRGGKKWQSRDHCIACVHAPHFKFETNPPIVMKPNINIRPMQVTPTPYILISYNHETTTQQIFQLASCEQHQCTQDPQMMYANRSWKNMQQKLVTFL